MRINTIYSTYQGEVNIQGIDLIDLLVPYKKTIPQFPDYAVTFDGSKVFKEVPNEPVIEMAYCRDKDGYPQTCLRNNGKRFSRKIHRLVGLTYMSNSSNYPFINHKDGVKQNNNFANLEWCNASQNTQHAYDNKLLIPKTGKDVNGAVLCEEDVLEIRRLYKSGTHQKPLAKRFKVSQSQISHIVTGKRW